MAPLTSLGQSIAEQCPQVSVVFVNWNSEDYLREAIKSIYDQTSSVIFEIIVVDNASKVGNIDSLQVDFPEIRLIKSQENLGFSRANNLGFRQSCGQSILFLNPDTKLLNPVIDILFGYAKTLPDAGVLGCRLLNTDMSVQTTCIQRFPTILNQILDIEYFRLKWPGVKLWDISPLFSGLQEPVKIEMISGACMMISRSIFEEVGLFSEEYFMYAEDLDLCYKTQKAGYHNYYVPLAKSIHHGGKSSGKRKANQWPIKMKCRAIGMFLRKTRGRSYSARYRMAIACSALLRLIVICIVIPVQKLILGRTTADQAMVKWLAIFKWAAWIGASPREGQES
jgi:GT2 family glycosyltransferase